MIVIVHGPQECGKTRHAQRLVQALNCKRIFDDVSHPRELQHAKDGDLILTNDIDGLRPHLDTLPGPVVILPFAEAFARLGRAG